jgi:hypothetical protein
MNRHEYVIILWHDREVFGGKIRLKTIIIIIIITITI